MDVSQVTTLLKAIDGATDERVRDVLRLLCKISPDAQRIATDKLLVDASKKREKGDTDLENNSEAETDVPESASERTDDSEVEYLGSTTTPRTGGAPASLGRLELYRQALSQHDRRDLFRDMHSARTVRRNL
ncbi:hypothetical protein BJX62DRAFT_194144, partial [Aspergillus germanicus]